MILDSHFNAMFQHDCPISGRGWRQ